MDMTLLEDLKMDDEILRRYSDGPSPAGLTEVVRAWHRFVWTVSFRLTGNEHDAADICQDVFLKLLLEPPAPGRVASARGYLAWCVIARAARMRRSAERRKAREKEAARRAGENGLADVDVEALRERITALPDDLRVPVELHYVAGLADAEIGVILGIADRTVRERLRRAREVLKEKLSAALLAAPIAWPEVSPPERLLADLFEIAGKGRALASLAAAPRVGMSIGMKTVLLAASVLLVVLAGGGAWLLLEHEADDRLASIPPAAPLPVDVAAAPRDSGPPMEPRVLDRPEAKAAPSPAADPVAEPAADIPPEVVGEEPAEPEGEEETVTVFGNVVDQFGARCPGVTVAVIDAFTKEPLILKSESDERSIRADDRGEFRVSGLPAGRELSFDVGGSRPDGAGIIPDAVSVFFEEAGGQELVIEVVLGATFRFQVDLPADYVADRQTSSAYLFPLEDEETWVQFGPCSWPKKRISHRKEEIGPDNRFVIGTLQPSDKPWVFRAMCADSAKKGMWGEVRLPRLDPGIHDIPVPATPYMPPERKPSPNFMINVHLFDESGRDLDTGGEPVSVEFEVGGTGMHPEELPGKPAVFTSLVRPEGKPMRAKVMVGDFSHLEDIGVVQEGGTYPVRCPLGHWRQESGALVIRLRDGKGAPADGWATARPYTVSPDFLETAFLDENLFHRFLRKTRSSAAAFGFLQPGTYKVQGAGTLPGDRFSAASSLPILIRAGETITVDLTLEPATRIVAQIPSAADSKLDCIWLSGSTTGGMSFAHAAYPNRGRFVTELIPPGKYTVVACGADRSWRGEVTVDGSLLDLGVELKPSAPTRSVRFRKASPGNLFFVEVRDGRGTLFFCRQTTEAEGEATLSAHLPDGKYVARYSFYDPPPRIPGRLPRPISEVKETDITVDAETDSIALP